MSNNTNGEFEQTTNSLVYLKVIGILTFLAAFLINSFFFVAATKCLKKRLHNLLIICLCMNNSIVTFATMIHSILGLLAGMTTNKIFCILFGFIMSYSLSTSYAMVFLISLERFIAIKTYNYGITHTLERNKRFILIGTHLLLLMVSVVVNISLPTTSSIPACSPVLLYKDMYPVYMGVLWAPMTILLLSVIVIYTSNCYVLWKMFFRNDNNVHPVKFIINQLPTMKERTGRVNETDMSIVSLDEPNSLADSVTSKNLAELRTSSSCRLAEHGTSNRLAEPSSFNQLDESNTSNRLAEPGSFNRLDESNTSNRLAEPGTSNRPAGPSSSNRLAEHGTSNRLAESGTSNRFAEAGISNRLAEPGTSNRLAEPGCSNRLDESGTSNRLDESGTSNRLAGNSNGNNADEHDIIVILQDTDSSEHHKLSSSVHTRDNEFLSPHVSLQEPCSMQSMKSNDVIGSINSSQSKWEHRAFVTNLIVTGTTIFLSLPFVLGLWIDLVGTTSPANRTVLFLFNTINYFLDPLVYIYRVPEIRNQISRKVSSDNRQAHDNRGL